MPTPPPAYSSPQAQLRKLNSDRERYRVKANAALQEEADPLDVYVRFVQWTEENYTGDLLPHSGLLSLLEEATRAFCGDTSYKGDLRYFKLWSKYASLVDRPALVYSFALQHGIGVVFSQLYEDYALELEREGLQSKAREVYGLGLKRKARPTDRLKKKCEEFLARTKASPPQVPPPRPSRLEWPTGEEVLCRHPLKNHPPSQKHSRSKSSSSKMPEPLPTSSAVSSGTTPRSYSHDRYAPMLAPAMPGKRPEKLRFDLRLLWTEEREEYSIQEARAKAMGLLTKDWGAEPDEPSPAAAPSAPSSSSEAQSPQPEPPSSEGQEREQIMEVDFNDEGTKSSRAYTRRKSMGKGLGEVTMTVNTKEALADVLGMYNSPTRTMRSAAIPGSKHAPLKKVAQPTFATTPSHSHSRVENANPTPKSAGPFASLMDENAGSFKSANRTRSNENSAEHGQKDLPPATPANLSRPAAVFTPFIDEPSNADVSRARTPASSISAVLQDSTKQAFVTPGGTAKPSISTQFTPFMDSNLRSKTPSATASNRKPLAVKETSTPFAPGEPLFQAESENENEQRSTKKARLNLREGSSSRPFTPFRDEEQPYVRNASIEEVGPLPQPMFTGAKAENQAPARAVAQAGHKVVPFADTSGPFQVSDRATASENAFVLRRGALRPNQASEKQASPAGNTPKAMTAFRPPLGLQQQDADGRTGSVVAAPKEYSMPRRPLGSVVPLQETLTSPPAARDEDKHTPTDDWSGDVRNRGEDGREDVQPQAIIDVDEDDDEFAATEGYEEEPPQGHPLGGSTLGYSITPTVGRQYLEEDAQAAAKRLEAEMKEDTFQDNAAPEDHELVPDVSPMSSAGSSFASYHESDTPPFRLSMGHTISIRRHDDQNGLLPTSDVIVDKTSALNLSDTLAKASSFVPPNPCNPFSPEIMSTLLSLIPPVDNFYNLTDREANLLDGLQKFAQKRAKKNGSGNASRLMESVDVFPMKVADRQLEVSDKLGEGGFGAVFSARECSPEDDDLDMNMDSDEEDEEESAKVALKVVKPRNLWEFHVLQRVHCTLPPHLKRSVVEPRALYAFRDESFLFLELCPQGSLLDVVNKCGQMDVAQHGGSLDELLVMFFTLELLRLVRGLHKAGFIHGDLKIDNCLIRLEDVPGGRNAWTDVYQPSGEQGWIAKGIKLIDFGRTVDTRLFPPGHKYIGDWATDARDCVELREGLPWTYQPDYYGLAGIVYCMLFGKYIESASVGDKLVEGQKRYYITTTFKRYWQGEIWRTLFDILLNSGAVRPDGELPLTDELDEVQGQMEDWLQANCNRSGNTLRGMLKKIEKAVLGGL